MLTERQERGQKPGSEGQIPACSADTDGWKLVGSLLLHHCQAGGQLPPKFGVLVGNDKCSPFVQQPGVGYQFCCHCWWFSPHVVITSGSSKPWLDGGTELLRWAREVPKAPLLLLAPLGAHHEEAQLPMSNFLLRKARTS